MKLLAKISSEIGLWMLIGMLLIVVGLGMEGGKLS